MATLDILGLDPSAPQPPPQPNQQPDKQQRKPAATAAPLQQQQQREGGRQQQQQLLQYHTSSSSSRSQPPLHQQVANLSLSHPPPSAASHSSHSHTLARQPSLSSASSAASSSPSPSPSPSPPVHAGSGSPLPFTPPIYAPPRSSFTRSRFLESQLSLRAGEFTSCKQMLVFAGTWNVNAKKVQAEADLSAWLLHRIRTRDQQGGEQGQGEDDDEDEDSSAHNTGNSSSPDSDSFKPPDLYVIGFQEIVDLNASNLLVDHHASEPWEVVIARTLARTGKRYVRVTTVQLVGLSMVIFVRDKHAHAVSDVRVDDVGVGIMGVGGNKGAVLVRLQLYKTTFCFVNSHLAAHQGAVRARNADWWSIIRRANFESPRKILVQDLDGSWVDGEEYRKRHAPPGSSSGVDSFAASASSLFDSGMSKFRVIMDNVAASKKAGGGGGGANGAGTMGGVINSSSSDLDLSPHDTSSPESSGDLEELAMIRSTPHSIFHNVHHVVWLGDNNYRLNVTEIGMAATHRMIEARDYTRLLSFDQLLQEKRARRTFIGFTEPAITFPPTYKFIPGTNTYDQRPDKKVRFPAYTDRIQFLTTGRGRNGAAGAGSLKSLQELHHAGSDLGALMPDNLHALYYASTWKLAASDHKPVMLLLAAPVIYEREKARKRILDDLKLLSDDECLPRLHLSSTRLDFGVVPYEYSVTRTVVLKNVGDVVVGYRCMVKSRSATTNQHKGGHGAVFQAGAGQDAVASKPWLRVHPSSGLLRLGQSQTLRITMHVTSRSGMVQLLNADVESLACELLMRLDSGAVYQVSLDACYEKSVCGSDLSFLTGLPCRNLRTATPADLAAVDDEDAEAYTIPPFLFRLVDFMKNVKNMIHNKQNAFVPPRYKGEEDSDEEVESEEEEEEEQVARPKKLSSRSSSSASTSSSSFPSHPLTDAPPQQVCTREMRWLLDYLDTGRSLDKDPRPASKWRSPAAPPPSKAPKDMEASVFLHTLLYFLSSLPTPLLVPSPQRWMQGMESGNLTSWIYQTLLELDVDKYRTLIYLLTFFREVVAHHRSNGCNVTALAEMLGVAICHKAAHAALSPLMPITPANIMVHLITSADFGNMPSDNSEHLEAIQMAQEQAPRTRYADIR